MIHRVPDRLVNDIWPAVEGFAKLAINYHPFMNSDDLLQVIHWGSPLFIATDHEGIKGFAVMEVVHYPRRKVANALACGGAHGFLSVAIHELLPVLKSWGAEQGADTFALSGRPGWVRALRNLGFESVSHVTMWADLNEGRRIVEQQADNDIRALEGGATLSH